MDVMSQRIVIPVTVAGTGAIGTAAAYALLAGGRRVVVWNRTPARTTDLVRSGAVAAETPQAGVTASDLTLVAVTDYAAVHEFFDALSGDLSGHTIAVLCTGTPADAVAAAARADRLGVGYLDVGVQSSPDDLGTDRATLMYSGSRESFERHHDTLALLSDPTYVGEAPHAAAVWDLALFGLWYDAQLGLLRALDVVAAAGVDVSSFADRAGRQLGHVVAAAVTTADELRDAAYPPGPATLKEHLPLLEQLVEQRSGLRLGDGGLGIVKGVVEDLVARGRAHEGLTATIGRGVDADVVSPAPRRGPAPHPW